MRSLASCLLFLFAASSVAAADRPNIIYILADDLGIGDLGCYGQKILQTPNIDRLASEGMKFTRHYAGSTVCAPSRCVLMTGLHTGHCRVRGNGPWTLPDTDMTVPKLLSEAGYHTACYGKYGLGKPLPDDDPQRKGFQTFYGYVDTSHAHNFYPTFLIHNGKRFSLPNEIIPGSGNPSHEDTGVATKEGRKEWAPGLIAESLHSFLVSPEAKQKPFFIYYALNIPHANNEAKKDAPLGHGLESEDYGPFAGKDWPDVEKGFAQFIRFLDDQVGAILATLDQEGIDKNTLILFSSDNGPHAEGGHDSDFFDSNGPYNGIKRSLTDGGIRVPLLARWPAKIKAGSVSNHVSGFQDLLPTVSDLCGMALEVETDGLSMVPVLTGEGTQREHDHLYWHFDEQGGKRAVLQWPWKLIHLNTGVGRDKDKAKGKDKPGAKGKAKLQVQLFNLDQDMGEQHNVAIQHPEIVRQLEAKMLAAWRDL